MPIKLNEMMAEAAKKGAALGTYKDPTMKMCEDCAFKKGTDANNDANAIQDAGNCLIRGQMFNCHTDFLEDAGRPCVGFLYAANYYNSLDKENEQ